MSKPFRIAIAGLGTVGRGVVKTLQDKADLIALRAQRPIEIAAVSARSKKAERGGLDLSEYRWCEDALSLADLPGVDAVVEVVGGAEGVAKTLIERAMDAGKHVVTANKALLAVHGFALAQKAESAGVSLNYEAAVAGGIPVIKTLREGLAGDDIRAVYGILNGTCNYILTEMRETGRDFVAVLKDAQAHGYAEADPTFDVGGIDAAHKLSILTALAFGVKPDFAAMTIEGIERITAQDIEYAAALGYRIKLLGTARRIGDKILQNVSPALVPLTSALGSVEGVFNAVYVDADPVDKMMAEGRGAGEGPTASAVVADIIDLARGVRLPVFGVRTEHMREAHWAGAEDVSSRFYLHLKVMDQPGVIADVSAILRDHAISIESLVQRGRDPGQPVSVVMVTHEARASAIDSAARAMSGLSVMVDAPTVIRIEHV